MAVKKIILSGLFTFLGSLIYAQQNTILILADDVGTDYFGFYEDAKDTANTPNIRALLSKGVRFTRAWSNPVCSPTRAAILTGRYGFRTGVGYVITNALSNQLDTSEMSIAKLLTTYAPVKYSTACVGKWHLHNQQINKLNYPKKFGYNFYSGNFNGAIPDYYNYQRVTNGVIDTVTKYATTQTVNDAIGWLDTISTSQPFFLWLAFNAAHSPYHKPPDSLHTVQGLTGTPSHINQNPKLYFKAAIEAMDTEIGRLFQWLSSHNMLDSTNIVFVGDNGNDKAVIQIADTTHLKGTLYEYGIHVPFIIAGPAVSGPGRVSNALVSTPDLFATTLEMSNFSNWLNFIPSNNLPVDSKSLIPILRNQSSTVRDWIFTEQFQNTSATNDGKAIRNDAYKLIRFDNGNQEFYHLMIDTLEQNDLLPGIMNTNDILNYNYLCAQLDTLLGVTYCLQNVSVIHTNSDEPTAYPSPFTTKIYIESPGMFDYQLYDYSGRVLLKGNGINHTAIDTEFITQGICILKIGSGSSMRLYKMIKIEKE